MLGWNIFIYFVRIFFSSVADGFRLWTNWIAKSAWNWSKWVVWQNNFSRFVLHVGRYFLTCRTNDLAPWYCCLLFGTIFFSVASSSWCCPFPCGQWCLFFRNCLPAFVFQGGVRLSGCPPHVSPICVWSGKCPAFQILVFTCPPACLDVCL